MAYSGLVSLSACKSYSRTSGSMRKYAVCGSMRELGGACGKYGEVREACRRSMRESAGSIAGRMREVCGLYAGVYVSMFPAPAYCPHTPRILPNFSPHTGKDHRHLVRIDRSPVMRHHLVIRRHHLVMWRHLVRPVGNGRRHVVRIQRVTGNRAPLGNVAPLGKASW